jgi:Asp-tRNA(Asn)/Glu-tRNA(Gln) amidotransferase C subunit
VEASNERELFQKNNKYTDNGYYIVPKIID